MERVTAIECRIPEGVAEIDVLIPVQHRLFNVEAKDPRLVVHDQPSVLKKGAAYECNVGLSLNPARPDRIGSCREDGTVVEGDEDRAIQSVRVHPSGHATDRYQAHMPIGDGIED